MSEAARKALDTEFWKRVEFGDEPWHCWSWSGAKHTFGYGTIKHYRQTHLAHRLSYRLHALYPIEPEVVMHRCDNPECVNPLHLVGGTHSNNRRDCIRKGRHVMPQDVGKNPAQVLTAEQAIEIYNDPRSIRALGREYGVSKSTVSDIKRGLTWAHATGDR